ncbi:MAG: hypothetical protein WCY98_07665 [Castellaniella sp.]
MRVRKALSRFLLRFCCCWLIPVVAWAAENSSRVVLAFPEAWHAR